MKKTRQLGFSLIELMIAITLGFVVIGALGTVFLGARQSYRVQDGMSRLQENGRYAMDLMARDIRQAGYVGCARDAKVTNIVSPAADYNTYTAGIVGYESGLPTGLTSSERIAGTDVVKVQFASSASVNLTGKLTTNNANIQLSGNPNNFAAGDVLFVTDCGNLDVFKATNVSNGASGITIAHSSSANSTNNLSKLYGADSEVMQLQTAIYYVGNGIGGVPTLFRKRLVGSALSAGEELVEGVQDMQILYGEDINGDLAADRYLDATTIGSNMNNVVSVRISLLMRSLDQITTRPVPYSFSGVSSTPTDRFLRRVFSSTVNLRNRTP